LKWVVFAGLSRVVTLLTKEVGCLTFSDPFIFLFSNSDGSPAGSQSAGFGPAPPEPPGLERR
jgi:hypothetical protein